MPTVPELYFEKLCLDAEGLVLRGDWRGAFKPIDGKSPGKNPATTNPYVIFDTKVYGVALDSVRALSEVQRQALLRLHMELADWSRDPHAVPALQMTDPLVPLYAGLSPYFCEGTLHAVPNPRTQSRYVLSALGVVVAHAL